MEMHISKSSVEAQPADQVEHCMLGLVAYMGSSLYDSYKVFLWENVETLV